MSQREGHKIRQAAVGVGRAAGGASQQAQQRCRCVMRTARTGEAAPATAQLGPAKKLSLGAPAQRRSPPPHPPARARHVAANALAGSTSRAGAYRRERSRGRAAGRGQPLLRAHARADLRPGRPPAAAHRGARAPAAPPRPANPCRMHPSRAARARHARRRARGYLLASRARLAPAPCSAPALACSRAAPMAFSVSSMASAAFRAASALRCAAEGSAAVTTAMARASDTPQTRGRARLLPLPRRAAAPRRSRRSRAALAPPAGCDARPRRDPDTWRRPCARRACGARLQSVPLRQAAENAVNPTGGACAAAPRSPSNPRARWVTQGRQRPLPSNPGSKLFFLTGTSSRRSAFPAAWALISHHVTPRQAAENAQSHGGRLRRGAALPFKPSRALGHSGPPAAAPFKPWVNTFLPDGK